MDGLIILESLPDFVVYGDGVKSKVILKTILKTSSGTDFKG